MSVNFNVRQLKQTAKDNHDQHCAYSLPFAEANGYLIAHFPVENHDLRILTTFVSFEKKDNS